MPFAVRPYFGNVTNCGHCPVAVDHVVIHDSLEAPLLLPPIDILHGEILALRCCGAIDYNFVNFFLDLLIGLI